MEISGAVLESKVFIIPPDLEREQIVRDGENMHKKIFYASVSKR